MPPIDNSKMVRKMCIETLSLHKGKLPDLPSNRQLYKNLEEAGAWKAMGFDIPESIAPIFADITTYKDLKKKVNDDKGITNLMCCNMTKLTKQIILTLENI